jgi:hypothetical protein
VDGRIFATLLSIEAERKTLQLSNAYGMVYLTRSPFTLAMVVLEMADHQGADLRLDPYFFPYLLKICFLYFAHSI